MIALSIVGWIALAWLVGTLPATFVAAKLTQDWTPDPDKLGDENPGPWIVIFWPIVALFTGARFLLWFVSWPLVWLYKTLWSAGGGQPDV